MVTKRATSSVVPYLRQISVGYMSRVGPGCINTGPARHSMGLVHLAAILVLAGWDGAGIECRDLCSVQPVLRTKTSAR